MTETQAHTQNAVVESTATSEASKPVVVPAEILAKYDNTVDWKEVKFNFRKDKELGTKRLAVELRLPVPSLEGIVAILTNQETDPKSFNLLLDAVAEVVFTQARSIVNDKEDINSENFPYDNVSWSAIAALPKGERRGGGIPKEVWEEWAKDYISAMPTITGKTVEQITNASKILLNKFSAVKDRKPVLKLLKDQLGQYVEHAENAEQYSECVQFLTEKADTLLNLDEAALLANL